jgi:hypothetical protein
MSFYDRKQSMIEGRRAAMEWNREHIKHFQTAEGNIYSVDEYYDLSPHERDKIKARPIWKSGKQEPEQKEYQEPPKDVINFAVWYSGMSREPVIKAWERYCREVITRKVKDNKPL